VRIAIVGGSGKEGFGLALRWAVHGHQVIIGSRSAEKARRVAEQLNMKLAISRVTGESNAEAAAQGEIIVLTVPYAAQSSTASELAPVLAGKVLVDVTVPLAPPVDRVTLPAGESAVLALQRALGNEVKVVSAFQNVSALHLAEPDHLIDCDVLVCGDDAEARATVIELASHAGMRAYHAGVLANSAAAEALTSVLIAMNKHYKVKASGLRLTGLP
jgi:8-hydroxy-5-deazaflavin:NADPH oxidoreductase